jgi:hypothetical protein
MIGVGGDDRDGRQRAGIGGTRSPGPAGVRGPAARSGPDQAGALGPAAFGRDAAGVR